MLTIIPYWLTLVQTISKLINIPIVLTGEIYCYYAMQSASSLMYMFFFFFLQGPSLFVRSTCIYFFCWDVFCTIKIFSFVNVSSYIKYIKIINI